MHPVFRHVEIEPYCGENYLIYTPSSSLRSAVE